MTHPPAGPGLAKARSVAIAAGRRRELVALRDGWWAGAIARADIMSEGRVMDDAGQEVYFGSTSLRYIVDPNALRNSTVVNSVEQLAQLIGADPHARLKLLRLAHREAVVRAGGTLNVLHAELTSRAARDGEGRDYVAVDIDVSAALGEPCFDVAGSDA